jgi:hypothetical protein
VLFVNIIPVDYSIHLNDILDLFSGSLKNSNGRDWLEWKHLRNPFGKSIGYIAEENGEVLGVRLFMPWQFTHKGKVLKALRPVDTVTKPEARGKGIFTSLTLKALEECKGKYDFIFNTPNGKSLPGYIKMGWRTLDQSFCHFYLIASPFKVSSGVRIENTIPAIDTGGFQEKENSCRTFITNDFLKWRYESDRYQCATLDASILIFERIQKKQTRILVVKEFVGNPELFRPLIHSVALKFYTPLILCTNNQAFNFRKPFLAFERGNSVVAYRGDNHYYNTRWNFSLGDLEGIL